MTVVRWRAVPCRKRRGVNQSSSVLPRGIFWEDGAKKMWAKSLILPVPGKGFEPLTFGLQNRCSTAELTRQSVVISIH
jgi:hypothetical protein